MGAAGIVLAGGRSRRMGRPKANLPWHGTTLLQRTVGILWRCLPGPLVVVRAPGQELPALPGGVALIDDPVADQGPLQGIAAGLGAVEGRAEVAFVVSTDLPFLDPALIRRVLEFDDGSDVLLPELDGQPQFLAAVYRPRAAEVATELLAAGERRLGLLAERCATRRISGQELLEDMVLRLVDPELRSLHGVNDDEAYRRALARPLPEVEVQRKKAVTVVQAAVAGLAVDAAGLEDVRSIVLDGRRYEADWRDVPLLVGDTITVR